MSNNHVGYLDLDGGITRFRAARCCFGEGQLDVEAQGSKCRLRLYGIPFPEARGVADLPGMVFGPDTETVRDDPIAEGRIEIRTMWLSYQSLMVRCRAFDAVDGTIIVSFEGRCSMSRAGSTVRSRVWFAAELSRACGDAVVGIVPNRTEKGISKLDTWHDSASTLWILWGMGLMDAVIDRTHIHEDRSHA